MLVRLVALVAALLAFASAQVAVPGAAQAHAGQHQMTATVNVRTAPSTGARKIGMVYRGEWVKLLCQANGSAVRGSRLWDLIEYRVDGTRRTKRGWVTDYYVRTGTAGAHAGVPFGDCFGTPPPDVRTITENTGTQYEQCLDSNHEGRAYYLECNGGNYQKWMLWRSPSTGWLQLRNVATGLCLDSGPPRSLPGFRAGRVYTQSCNGGNFQRWQDFQPGNLEQAGSPTRLKNAATGLCLSRPVSNVQDRVLLGHSDTAITNVCWSATRFGIKVVSHHA